MQCPRIGNKRACRDLSCQWRTTTNAPETVRKGRFLALLDYFCVKAYIFIVVTLAAHSESPVVPGAISWVDKLVLATVNAPYSRNISSAILEECLAKVKIAGWPAHLASFFTELKPELVLSFASEHGVSESNLTASYEAVKDFSGESNPGLEEQLVLLASAA